MLSNNSGREALRGAEMLTLDLIFETLTPQQWAELLKAPLERAAAKGNSDLAQRLVRAGAQVGDALHEAVEGRHGEIVSDLLESGASLAAKDKKGRTPLHVACTSWWKTDMVQLLLLKGADKDALDDEQRTPLFMAAHQGYVATTQALLAAGADASLRCGELRSPAMHVAAEEGHVDILRAVIEHGAGVDAVDINQSTALHSAASNRKVEAIDVLIEAGANVDARDSDGWTPLHCASYYLGHYSLLCLLKHGATVNTRDQLLDTPLMAAASKAGEYFYGASNVVDSLLRAGADESTYNDEGRKAADVVGQSVEEEVRQVEDVERVRELLANAPADRAWRRRGYLVLCRAHPDRVQRKDQMMISGIHHIDTAQRTHSDAKLARPEGIAGDVRVDEGTGGDWTAVLSKVLLMREEGIFRTIVGYL